MASSDIEVFVVSVFPVPSVVVVLFSSTFVAAPTPTTLPVIDTLCPT